MILMYHKVSPEVKSMWWVSVNAFYRQICELAGKNVVYLDDYDVNNPNHVVITFDGVYSNVREFAAPILKHFGYPFELFVSGDFIGRSNEFDTVEPSSMFANRKELDEMVQMGARLQWHSKSHQKLVGLNVSDEQIRFEVILPPDLRESLSGEHFKWFGYPHGLFDDRSKRAVSEHFHGALACDNGDKNDRFALPRVTVTEKSKLTDMKISCIVASYNYGRFLPDALESVLSQTVLPDEILVVDDGSIDETAEIAEDYRQRYPELIRFLKNDTNQGIVKTFNAAVDATTGNLIVILGADNRLLSNYVEKCAAALQRDSKLGVVYTDFYLFGDRAKLLFERFNPRFRGRELPNGVYEITFPEFSTESLELLHSGTNFIHGSSMFRRDSFKVVGGYLEKEGRPEDFDLFTRMIDAGWLAKKVIGTALEYRQHSKDQINLRLGMANLALHYYRRAKRLEAENSELTKRLERQFFLPIIKLKDTLGKVRRRVKRLIRSR